MMDKLMYWIANNFIKTSLLLTAIFVVSVAISLRGYVYFNNKYELQCIDAGHKWVAGDCIKQ